MGFVRKIILFVFLTGCLKFSAQNYVITKSVFEGTGDAGNMVYGDVTIVNTSANPIQLFMHRFSQTLPANWYTCYCYLNCYPTSQDSLYINIPAGSSTTVSIGFTTDLIPNIGHARFTLEEVGSALPKDTLNFSGSTIASGIKEIYHGNFFSVYPNPSHDKITFSNYRDENYMIEVFDLTGKTISRYANLDAKQFVLNLESYPAGYYFIKASYKSGKTEIKKIIKN